ncbi:MAG TPA: DUF21 domain-containing protein [Candidatus Atribacteria bacterium]|nr:DUF21 domain-containing protein [Candidatus Atribacteria bacterium]
MLNIILIILGIVFLNAIISMTEAAFFSASLVKIEFWSKKSWRARILRFLKKKSETAIVTIVSLSNIVTIGGSMFIGALVTARFGSEWLGVTSGVVIFIMMVFSEIIPKRIGERYYRFIALNSAIFLLFLSFIFKPLAWLVMKITGPLTIRSQDTKLTSEEEISFLVDLAGQEGSIEADEKALIKKAFILNDLKVRDLKEKIEDIVFIREDQSLFEIKDIITSSHHLYLPVVSKKQDKKPVGIINRLTAMTALLKGYNRLLVADLLITNPLLVSMDEKLDDLLEKFKKNRTELAIVINENKEMVGVVELDRVLEIIIGQIGSDN